MIKGSPPLLECLNLLEELSLYRRFLSESPKIIEAIWPVFGLFEFSNKIEFEDNILVIFKNIAKAE